MYAAHSAGRANVSRSGYASWRRTLADPSSVPSVRAILLAYNGSWSAARDALAPKPPSDDDLLNLVRQCAEATGSTPTMWVFDAWGEESDAEASAKEITARLGRWRDVVERAGLSARRRSGAPAPLRRVQPDRADRARAALRRFAQHLGLSEDVDAATSYEVAHQLRREAYAAWRRDHCPTAPGESSVHGWYGRWAGALWDAGLASAPESPPRPPRWDDEAIVQALRSAASTVQTGRPLTIDEYDAWQRSSAGEGAPTRRYVWDRYESWAGALLNAGLIDPGAPVDVLPALRAWLGELEPGREANPEAYLQWSAQRPNSSPTVRSVMKAYDTWRAAIAAAGGAPPDRNPTGRVFENDELVKALRRWAATERGDVLTRGAFRGWARKDATAPADGVVSERWGSWDAALEAAGLVSSDADRSYFTPVDPGAVERALRAFAAAVPVSERSGYRYDAWRASEARWAPSSTTVWSHFERSWPAVRAYMVELPASPAATP